MKGEGPACVGDVKRNPTVEAGVPPPDAEET